MTLQWVKANYDLQTHQNWFCDGMLTSDGGVRGSNFYEPIRNDLEQIESLS
jgi:hypothetical protein